MFVVGKEYQRKTELHDLYGGQRQGGISTPKDQPFIFIITSSSGEKHGYSDHFAPDGTFWYTGEGQVGDMTMDSGNKAIFEHAAQGKAIHLFEQSRKGHVCYVGEAEYVDYHIETRPDTNGDMRKAFIFHLNINSSPEPLNTEPEGILHTEKPQKELAGKDLQELRTAAISQASRSAPKTQRVASIAYRSTALKLYVAKRAQGICEGCNTTAPFETKSGPYLEVHHLHRLADGGPDHPSNVVGICPNCHRRAHHAIDAHVFNEHLKTVALAAESKLGH